MGLFFIAVGMSIDFGLLARTAAARSPALVRRLHGCSRRCALACIAAPLGVAARPALAVRGAARAGRRVRVRRVRRRARGARCCPASGTRCLTLVVALSMAVTPLLLVVARPHAPRAMPAPERREHDTIEAEDAPVIIAGFGRFGQIVGRLLFASGMRADRARPRSRPDRAAAQVRLPRLLRRRHAPRPARGRRRRARAACSSTRSTTSTTASRWSTWRASTSRTCAIIARARNVTHYARAARARRRRSSSARRSKSALRTGRRALEALGVAPYEARESADRFRRHNIALVEALQPLLRDDARRFSAAKAGREELEAQFKRDRQELDRIGASGWHHDLENATEERE